MTPRPFRTATTIVAGLLLFACADGDNQVAPITLDTGVPVPAASVTTSAAPSITTIASTDAPTTTVEPTTSPGTDAATTVVDELTGPMFSDALGVKVDTAPGIHTRGDTRQLLPEGLYVHIAWESDPNDLSVFSPTPEDIPILEAYANGAAAYYRAATSTVTTDAADFKLYFRDGGAKFDAAFRQARDGGYVENLGEGVTLRPYVLADNRTATSAMVLDCSLSFEQWVSVESPYVKLASAQLIGNVATMTNIDGHWVTDTLSAEDAACM